MGDEFTDKLGFPGLYGDAVLLILLCTNAFIKITGIGKKFNHFYMSILSLIESE